MKHLTKGELLLLLGDSANGFTAFMMHPENFGVAEPNLTALRVAKQKLDWTASINVDLPEVQGLINTLEGLGVISNAAANAVRDTPDRVAFDDCLISVKAQDVITADNIYGAVFDGNMWKITIDYYNTTKNSHTIEDAYYSKEPTQADVTETVTARIAELKRG